MNFKDLYVEYFGIITAFYGFVSLLLIASLKSYFTEKGKLKAQISENKRLVEQTESIKSQFNRELEELRKEHQLDISKRKYQYESKKEQYFKFFKLLDEFSAENNTKSQEKFLPILDEFNRNFLNSQKTNNLKATTNATIVFQKKTQKLVMEGNQDLIRIKQETNSIRLIASDEVLDKLDLLTMAYDKAFEKSSAMMKELNILIMTGNEEAMKKHQREIEVSAQVINKFKNDIIVAMRNELKEI